MMSKAGAPTMGTFLVRWARWLGLDRNPLRRTVDRVETFVRLTVLILLLAGVPAGLFVAGRVSDQVFLQQARTQRSSDRQVTAVLTQPAPTVGTVDPYSSVQTTWANARWMAPNGTAHSGQVLVAADAPRGATARVWINAAGAITDPPVAHRDVMAEVAVTVMVTGITLILLLLGAEALAVRSLDHRRFSAWDAEWRSTGPQWTDHRT
jgi:hypothetical protein